MQIDRRRHSIRRIALTPMIDVVFLLLAFFLLASTFSRVQTRPFVLDGGSETRAERQTPPLAIILKENGALTLNGTALEPGALEPALSRQMAADPARAVTIEPENGVTVQALLDLLDRVEALAVRSVRLVYRPDQNSTEGPD